MRMTRGFAVSAAVLLVVVMLVPAGAEAKKGKRTQVTFNNASSWDIYELYLSSSSQRHWGPDQLGEDVLGSGQYLTLSGISCGTYDVMAVDEDDEQCVLTGIDLCGREQWDITDEELLSCEGYEVSSSLTIYNQSRWDIYNLFLSPSTSRSWGPDQLDDEILGSGQYFELHGIDCNTYDVRMVDEDGDECIVEQIDLCAEEAGWHITDRILLSCQRSS